MDNIKIRQATTSESDLNNILKYIYQTEEFPGGSIKECVSWTITRLENGFYIQVAEVAEKIIGHSVWNISDEPDKKIIYLSMIQIDENYRRKGIGRAMIADGIVYARKIYMPEKSCEKSVGSSVVCLGQNIVQ